MLAKSKQRRPEKHRARPHGGLLSEKDPDSSSCPNHGRKALHEQWARPHGAPRPHGVCTAAKMTCKIRGQAPCCLYSGKGC